MNDIQQFLIEKMKMGASKIAENPGAPELMTQEDVDLLLKRTIEINPEADQYVGITEAEWMEWSKNIHWVLQVAFLEDTLQHTDKEKINRWRDFVPYYTQMLAKQQVDQILVLESITGHFMRHDLLPVVVRVFGKTDLNEFEKRWTASKHGPGVGSGCLVPVLLGLVAIGFFLILI